MPKEPANQNEFAKGHLPLVEERNTTEPPNRVTAQPPPGSIERDRRDEQLSRAASNAPRKGSGHQVARDVWIIEGGFVNAFVVGTSPEQCVIVDTGMPGSGWSNSIMSTINQLGRIPTAIVLTHGHADHTGAARQLAERYDIPIYAHPRELPYLEGRSDYPPPDPTVGGFHANLSRFLPYRAQQLGQKLTPLTSTSLNEGEISEMPGWRWIFTPGHSPGHIALFRAEDKVLIAGDALETTNMDSWSEAVSKPSHFWRGGTPFTCDWQWSERSVATLAELDPSVVVAGHGRPITGADTAQLLRSFAKDFPVPKKGRYVGSPAVVSDQGVVSLPPKPTDAIPYIAAALGAGAAFGLYKAYGRRSRPDPMYPT